MPAYLNVPSEIPQEVSLFKTFMNHCPLIAWIADSNGRIIYSNKAYRKLFRTGERSANITLYDLFPTAIAETYKHHNDLVLELNTAITAVVKTVLPGFDCKYYRINKFPICLDGELCVGGWAMECAQEEYSRKIDLLVI